MFLVPEILWGLCGNVLYNIIRFMFSLQSSKVSYSLFQFFDSSQSRLLLNAVLLGQLAGLLGIFIIILKSKIKKIIKYLLLLLLLILIFSNIYFLVFIFNFNPQIG